MYRHNPELTGFARELRRNMTRQERRLWYDFLKDYPVRFLRQKVVARYIADFYCARADLIVELDGSQHYEEGGALKDAVRTEQLEQWGLTVLRIPNQAVDRNFQGVCDYLDLAVRQAMEGPPPQR